MTSFPEIPPRFSVCLYSRSGKKNKLRVYYLSWLRNRILHNDPEVEKKQGWITVGELEGCVHYKVGKDLCVCVCVCVCLINEGFNRKSHLCRILKGPELKLT